MYSEPNTIHLFDSRPPYDELPKRFNCPFHYLPHPLAVKAAQEVQNYIMSRPEWHEELEEGKMFGVLIAEKDGQYAFFAAYSGILNGKNNHPYFVPAVYDMLQPDGYFKTEERAISDINRKIKELLESEEKLLLQKQISEIAQQREKALEEHRNMMKAAKEKRDTQRQNKNISSATTESLLRESQHLKAEHKRLIRHWDSITAQAQINLLRFNERIEILENERKQRSAALQHWLFRQFVIRNAKGETKDLIEIFKDADRPFPPSGTGECAAPKLLQYAFLHGWRPLTMAEFWWGKSPQKEVRRHGYYYPSCKTKCEPILNFMLQGLDVEPNIQECIKNEGNTPRVIYEDDCIIAVDKPAGMLSVPGKDNAPSVWSWAKENYPIADGPLLVHRLDMDTSGILIIAKDKETHRLLQSAFETRKVKKRYTAIVIGTVTADTGIIQLPMCPNPDDRPRQMVSEEYGKPAVTRYEVISRDKRHTRLSLYPITGRTHQLRVHCAHQQGLNAPIVGDNLYGQPDKRLYLHATSIEFRHTKTGRQLHLESPAPF